MEEIITLTEDLIRFRTIHSQPAEIQRCVSFIEDYLKTCGAGYQRLDHAGTSSIIVMPQNNVVPILLLLLALLPAVTAAAPRNRRRVTHGRGVIMPSLSCSG